MTARLDISFCWTVAAVRGQRGVASEAKVIAEDWETDGQVRAFAGYIHYEVIDG